MTFIGMILRKVDPFAVYAAERQLADCGVSVPRESLITHYLIRGQLRTTVRCLCDGESESIDVALAKAIIEGPDESKNPRFVAPLRTGLLCSVVVTVMIGSVVAIKVVATGIDVSHTDWRGPAIVFGIVITTCMAYAFAGARFGRERARAPVMACFGLAAAGLIYWMTRRPL